MSYDADYDDRPRSTSAWAILGIVFAVVAGLLLLGVLVLATLLLPAIQAAREAARRSNCTNNARNISIALQAYHDTYNCFPPAYVADADGKPMHSWRVLILPFMEQQGLYDRYNFSEPWDGPNNSRLAAAAPDIFHCPSSDDGPAMTNYVAIIGPQTGWPGSQAIKSRDIKDGTATTVAVVEVDGAGIHWMEPRDITFDIATKGINVPQATAGISSSHSGGVNCLFFDGSVHFLSNDVSPDVLRGLLTISGGEDPLPLDY